MKNAGYYFVMVMALVTLRSPAVQADTLELRDGRLLEGTYAGGTSNTLRIQIEDRVEVIPIQEVLALTIDSGSYSSGPASGSQKSAADRRFDTGNINVRAGTHLLVRLSDNLNSGEDGTGGRFTAILETNLTVDGRLVAPKGSTVYGRLASTQRGGRTFGRGRLELELTDIVISGERYPIITSDYEVQGRSQGTVTKTLGGAVLGALIDGSDGAKTGAAAGLGLSLLTRGKQVSIPAGTLIDFRLQQPLTVHG